MNRSIVIYGPQGCGKTRNAEAIAAFYGLKVMGDYEFRRRQTIPTGGLYLCVSGDQHTFAGRRISYDDAIKAMGGHVTQWFNTDTHPPVHKGRYEVRRVDGENLGMMTFIKEPFGRWEGNGGAIMGYLGRIEWRGLEG